MRLLLVRHATCDPVGRTIAGRAPGVSLNAEGREQARALAARLASAPMHAAYSSPLERARETAEAVARPHGLAVRVESGLQEIDFGDWTGCALDALAPLPEWRAFNERRSTTRIPGGELMLEVQARAVVAAEAMRARHGRDTVLAVSHGDVIRSLVAYYLGTSLDHLARFEVAPASVTTIEMEPWGVCVLRLNDAP